MSTYVLVANPFSLVVWSLVEIKAFSFCEPQRFWENLPMRSRTRAEIELGIGKAVKNIYPNSIPVRAHAVAMQYVHIQC